MLINPYGDGEARPASDQQDVTRQKYETMQCFAVSEPKSIKEEGEGILSRPICLSAPPSLSPSSLFQSLVSCPPFIITSLDLSSQPQLETNYCVALCHALILSHHTDAH